MPRSGMRIGTPYTGKTDRLTPPDPPPYARERWLAFLFIAGMLFATMLIALWAIGSFAL